MAFPTVVNDALQDSVLATAEIKADQLIGRAKLIKDIAAYVSGEVPMVARRLSQLQNSLFAHKAFIQTESLNTAASRAVIAAAYPQYANAAAVQTDIQAANGQFVQFTVEIEAVLAQARAAGQLIDNDPVTGAVIEPNIPEGNMTALRAFASALQASLG